MDNTKWYADFIEILYKKYPKRALLTNFLMNLLEIEREAVYRRLRKDVLFPIDEIVKIAVACNISLDELTCINDEQFTFQMRQINYIDPSKEEMDLLNYIIQSISYLKNCTSTEFMNICNKLPRQLLAGYPYLNQFYLFKWLYQYGNENESVPFSEVIVSKEKAKITQAYLNAIKLVPRTSFIFDRRIFEFLVNDIHYFCSIYLITEEEKKLIKKDLISLLNYLLEVANKGCYPETQNKVSLYISQINVDTNYSYTFTPEVNICYVHVFEKFEIFSLNSEMVSNFITWMQLKKKSSFQISEVDERSRIEFFMKQQNIIDSL